ncbi:hypothetical protein M3914_002463 [Vibrio metschnikovii]|nr:hypothetical protein [Vibrio metschnikovii]EKO3684259.1 hypothetical protein [Vibrio metschnikovii]
MKIIASMIESAQWQAWLSQQNSPYPIVTNSKKPCTNEVTIVAAPCSLAEIDSDLLDYDELVIHIWGLQATLANALRNGAEEAQIDSVVAKWVEMSEQLLAWLPKHQHKVNVLSHAHATYFTQDWCEWLNNLGIEWPQTDINTTCARTSQDEYDLFAAYYVKIHPQLERLEQLLLSVALPMGEDYPQLPLSIAELTRQSQHAIRRQRYTDKQLTIKDAEKQELLVKQEVLIEQISLTQQKIIQLTEQNRNLNNQLEQAQENITQRFEELAYITKLHLESENALNNQKKQYIKLNDTKEKEVAKYKLQVSQLKDKLAKETSVHQKKYDQQAIKTKQAEANNKTLTNDLKKWQQENSQLHKTVEDLNSQLSAQQQQSVKHVEQLQLELNNTKDELTNYREQYQVVQSRYHSLTIQLEDEKQVRHELEQQLNQAKTDVQQRFYEIAKLTQKLLSLEEQLSVKPTEPVVEQSPQAEKKWHLVEDFLMLPSRFKKARKSRMALRKQVEIIKKSTLFDASWYLTQYPEVKSMKYGPEEHYILFGANQHFNPSDDFDTEWYLINYPDVKDAGINPLLHYIKYGKNEGRLISSTSLEENE